jgi:hypothetical protein
LDIDSLNSVGEIMKPASRHGFANQSRYTDERIENVFTFIVIAGIALLFIGLIMR